MKRFAPFVLMMSLALAVFAPPAVSAEAAPAPKHPDKSPASGIATAISTVTGIAISPLLGTAGFGAYKWLAAGNDAERAKLPWFAQIKFWLPALLIVGVCAFKDTLGTIVPPGLKKPLDVLETLENKFSGLVAAGAVVPLTMETITGAIFGGKPGAFMAPEFASSGVATIHLAAFDASSLLSILTVPFGIAVFCFVWLASHAINVLILLSPWGAIDAALKGLRTALLGLITLSAQLDPRISAALSVVVIIVAYFVAGWAFRLTIFGWIFSWEFVTRRRNRFSPAENDNAMFAGGDLPGVPIRSYGKLAKKSSGGLEFTYRPWLLLPPRTAAVPGEGRALAVGQGAFFSDVLGAQDSTLFTLPPRYRGHEEALARAYAMSGVKPAGLRKAWSSLKSMLGGKAAPAAA